MTNARRYAAQVRSLLFDAATGAIDATGYGGFFTRVQIAEMMPNGSVRKVMDALTSAGPHGVLPVWIERERATVTRGRKIEVFRISREGILEELQARATA